MPREIPSKEEKNGESIQTKRTTRLGRIESNKTASEVRTFLQHAVNTLLYRSLALHRVRMTNDPVLSSKPNSILLPSPVPPHHPSQPITDRQIMEDKTVPTIHRADLAAIIARLEAATTRLENMASAAVDYSPKHPCNRQAGCDSRDQCQVVPLDFVLCTIIHVSTLSFSSLHHHPPFIHCHSPLQTTIHPSPRPHPLSSIPCPKPYVLDPAHNIHTILILF